MKTRGAADYNVKSNQQGRKGRKRGAFVGRKQRGTRKRRSPRGVDSSSDNESSEEDSKPPAVAPRKLRNQPITCINFGPHREHQYPDHFFCKGCANWENAGGTDSVAAVHLRKSAKRSSNAYKCTGGHTSAIFPTRLKTNYLPSISSTLCRRRNIVHAGRKSGSKPRPIVYSLSSDSDTSDDPLYEPSSDEESDSGSDDDIQSPAAPPAIDTPKAPTCVPQDVTEQHLRDRIRVLEAQVNNLRQREKRCEAKVPTVEQDSSNDLTTTIKLAIEKAVESRNRRRLGTRVANAIASAAFDAFDGLAETELREITRKWYRKNIWPDWKVGRLMDQKGGCLNYSGLELLRSLETEGNAYVRTFLPCSAAIKHIYKRVETIGKQLTPFMLTSDEGESIRFDYAKCLRHILKSFSLDGAAIERAIKIAQSIDGARLTAHITNIMAGMKMRDLGAICPQTQTPLISPQNHSQQSRDIIFPFHLNLGKETKDKFNGEFRPLFEFFGKVEKNGFEGSLPFCISTEIDLSAAWKGLMRGGGAKVHSHPCQCCGSILMICITPTHQGAPDSVPPTTTTTCDAIMFPSSLMKRLKV